MPTVVPALTKVLISTIVLSNPGIGETIRRVRGFVAVNAVASAAGSRLGALGMVVVSDIALAAGVASIPGPVTERGDDGWFVWQATGGARPAATGTESTIWPFDSKAMRRVEEGFGIAIVFENANAVAPSINVEVAMSVLASLS